MAGRRLPPTRSFWRPTPVGKGCLHLLCHKQASFGGDSFVSAASTRGAIGSTPSCLPCYRPSQRPRHSPASRRLSRGPLPGPLRQHPASGGIGLRHSHVRRSVALPRLRSPSPPPYQGGHYVHSVCGVTNVNAMQTLSVFASNKSCWSLCVVPYDRESLSRPLVGWLRYQTSC